MTPSGRAPDVADVDRIAALGDPVLRNLQITQCYHELSAALADRIGPGANWCTFATWASKQAGQTIRKEDITRTLAAALDAGSRAELAALIAAAARRIGAKQSDQSLHQSIWRALIEAPLDRAGDAVSRGNRKVFEEIGRECARFQVQCLRDPAYIPENIQRFCGELRPGAPPEGQQYLIQAFTRYYESLFEPDAKTRAELQLLANLEIGLHEQTRLQPEIRESLDAAIVEPEQFRRRLIEAIFPSGAWWTRLRLFALKLLGRRSPFDEAVEALAAGARDQLRLGITAHLMTLTIPPDVCLRLGQDLTVAYPEALRELSNAELRALLQQIDPTPDSVRDSGAVDWADLPERMHFIGDLFRCYHASEVLFEAPFTAEQVLALKGGRVPGGQL